MDVDTGSTASANVTKKTENKKAENKKTGKNLNLKNLLNQRLKRLKLEEDTINCEQLALQNHLFLPANSVDSSQSEKGGCSSPMCYLFTLKIRKSLPNFIKNE